jgi:predicted Zn finger-like uncharacterized protein
MLALNHMQASCTNCGTQHVLNDAQVAGNSRVQFRCSKCGETSTVEVTAKVDSTMVITPLPSFARVENSGGTRPNATVQYPGLSLPQGAVVKLTVVSGPSKGSVHQMDKPRVVIGRADADLDLNDPEVSRWHCAIEVKDRIVRLRDLDSTNGTYFEEERVRAAELLNDAEFRIGSSVVRVTVEPK